MPNQLLRRYGGTISKRLLHRHGTIKGAHNVNTWVQSVLDMLKNGEVNGAIAEVQGNSTLADLEALEIAYGSVHVEGALGFKAVLRRRIAELRAVAAAAVVAAATGGPASDLKI